MAIIRPFKGIRPKRELAEQVASRPYDVLDSREARVEADGNPYSFLHVIKPEIDLPEETDLYSQPVYDKARENFSRMRQEGILVDDPQPCLYIYRQMMDGKPQTGIVACSSIDDYFNDVIRKHEFTRPKKEQDRINHMRNISAHPGPVFLTYRRVEDVDRMVDRVTQGDAEYDFTAPDGVRHIFWTVTDPEMIETIVALFAERVPETYIADGHHRAASSAKVGKALRDANGNNPDAEYNFFLSVLFPDDQLQIIDYNRLVTDLHGLSKEDFLARVADRFDIEEMGAAFKPESPHTYGMYMDGTWYKLTAQPGTFDPSDPVSVLDVSVLSDNLLAPVLGIVDQRTDDRIDFVGGIRGLGELERRVDSGEMALAFAIFPVSIQQLMDIADSGNVMPPKSTWFEPKLRSGLIVHEF